MIASCKAEPGKPIEDDKKASQLSEDRNSNDVYERPSSVEPDEKSQKALDELLRRVTLEGSSLKDAKASELYAAYERKIQILQARGRDLENLVRAKDEALAQSEKLRHYRAESHMETEISKIREITQECEALREQNKHLTDCVRATKAEYERSASKMNQECESLKSELKETTKTAESYLLTCRDLENKIARCHAEKTSLQTDLDSKSL